jgi:hypothetical protein
MLPRQPQSDLTPLVADEGERDGSARKVEHHQEQFDRQYHDRAFGPCLQLTTQSHELALSSIVFWVLAEAFQCEWTCVQGHSEFAERGKEVSRAEIALPLGGCNVDGCLRITQRVFETILLFVDGQAGVE